MGSSMPTSHNEVVVMSVGGSLIVPDEIDTNFLTQFKTLIERQVAENRRRFVIITGGGKTARRYQEAAGSLAELTPEDIDWIGIHATRLNGHLLRTIFRDIAHPVVYHKLDDGIKELDAPLIIAAGARPGNSSDYVATHYASVLGAKRLINLSNLDYVYTADPKKDLDAEKIEDIAWQDFMKLIPSEWNPGLSSPFDPVASRNAAELGIEVAQINGHKLEELEKYLNGESFVGTRIHNGA